MFWNAVFFMMLGILIAGCAVLGLIIVFRIRDLNSHFEKRRRPVEVDHGLWIGGVIAMFLMALIVADLIIVFNGMQSLIIHGEMIVIPGILLAAHIFVAFINRVWSIHVSHLIEHKPVSD